MKTFICFILSLTVLGPLVADAQWDDRFRSKEHPEAAVNPALQIMLTAPGRYYAITGHWPSAWQEVRELGLVQAPLYLPTGQEVNPDSNEWTPKNLRYKMQAGQNPELWVLDEATGTGIRYHTLVGPGFTWTQFLESLPDSGKAIWAPAVQDEDRLVHFGIITLLRESIRQYIEVHGTAPASFDELLNSGLSPIDVSSVNPLTGERFYGDGRPNDLIYVRGSNGVSFTLKSVAPDGSTPWHGSYL